MSSIKELWALLRTGKNHWLWPIVVTMAVLGLLIVLGQGSAMIAFI